MGKANRAIMAVALCAWGSAVPAAPSPDCHIARTIEVPAKADKHGHAVEPAKHAYELADGSRLFVGRFTVDADGAPHAYNPAQGVGLDDLRNAGRPGHWFGIATDEVDRRGRHTCNGTGKPVTQSVGEPAPGYYVATTSMHDQNVKDCTRQRRYVNSEAIPYVALPPSIGAVRESAGPFAVLARAGRDPEMAIMADSAPTYGIGEGSIELARRLGYSPSPRSGGTGTRELVYLVLTERAAFPRDATAVRDGARPAFERWGGAERLAACVAVIRGLPR